MTGRQCDECEPGFKYHPDCTCKVFLTSDNDWLISIMDFLACDCNVEGRTSPVCNAETGQCPCKTNIIGMDCSKCADGFFGFPNCTACGCHDAGTTNWICDKTIGQCPCKENYTGRDCGTCAPGYKNFPDCIRKN